MTSNDIYAYIQEQESGYKQGIPLDEGWFWSMKDHIRRSFLYKHSQFERDNENRDKRPFKNIVRGILNVQYRTEGFDVKDIEIYVDNPDTYYKSFLIKKYHDKWALENQVDTFIDELVQSYVDYGGALIKNVKGIRPEVVDLKTIAFCDQTDILKGPFAIKHYFSPSELRDMTNVGWGTTGATISIEDLILKAESSTNRIKEAGETKTPGNYIEVYEVHNCSPQDFEGSVQTAEGYNEESKDYSEPMIYVCAFYSDENGNPQGVTLFANKEPKLPFKFIKRDPIQGRTLGWGGIEELFEAQMWTNFAEINIMAMLEHASKVFYKTTDPKFKNQNVADSKMGRIFDLQPNSDMSQVDNQPRNLVAFTNAVQGWHEHGMEIGGASELFLGKQPTAGTPFASVEEQVKQNTDLHTWRQGQIATFLDEIYRDWIIPQLARELTKGSKFLSTLSADEMQMVGEAIVTNQSNRRIIDMVLDGKIPTPEEIDAFKQVVSDTFAKQGNKKFIEIIKDEMSGEKLSVSTNIAGKQKDLAGITTKMVNVVRQVLQAPQLLQDPMMVKWLNSILEGSGLSPIMFGARLSPLQPSQGQGQSQSQPQLQSITQ